jgi:ribulose-phosphate 3-epimerase
MQIQILPSLLAGDFGHLADSARLAERCGGDALHLDIMDGHFVPNLSMGPDVVAMARETVSIPLSVHLMMTNPDQYALRFIEAGADSLLIHIEAECDVPDVLQRIREQGARPGITLNPETPVELVFPVLELVDEVLCMTVRPGYGGQSFMPEVLPKIRALRDYANAHECADLCVLVDGGINVGTGVRCAAVGANALIAGTSLYAAEDMAAEIARMRRAAQDALVI